MAAAKARARRISVAEGMADTASDAFGGRYVTPYALALGANHAQIGLLSSLPPLLGGLAQILTLRSLRRGTSRKRLAFAGGFLQALMWVPILFLGLSSFSRSGAVYALVGAYTLLVLFDDFVRPAWGSWMKDLVTEETGSYFGKRSRIIGIFHIGCMLAAGAALDAAQGLLFWGFAGIFLLAFLSKLLSAFLYTRQYEPPFKAQEAKYFSFRAFTRQMHRNNFGRFAVFIATMTLAHSIAGPFFAVYMLEDLDFTYLTYITITLGAALAGFLSMPLWGRFADRHGNRLVLRICGFLVPFGALLWLAAPFLPPILVVPYLLAVEVLSGLCWAGFNLAASTFVYEAVTRQRMALCVAYGHILNSLGIFAGAALGGLLASATAPLGMHPLLFVFLLSGILRFLVAALLLPHVREVRKVEGLDLPAWGPPGIFRALGRLFPISSR